MYLEREDVNLYYETYGEGEPLLLIHGVIVDAQLYLQAARLLSGYYQVILYDRRRNSRSVCRGEKPFSIEDQAEDIRVLLDTLGIQKAWIVGTSAGAAVGEYFLYRYPERVRHLLMYEPALLGYLMETSGEFREWAGNMERLVEQKKISSAILSFSRHIGFEDPRSPQKPEEYSRRMMENFEYALTVEIPGLLQYRPDLDRMKVNAGKITLAAGEKSGDTVYRQAALTLAERIGKHALFFPGGHNLPYDLPKEFAVCVLGTLMLVRSGADF